MDELQAMTYRAPFGENPAWAVGGVLALLAMAIYLWRSRGEAAQLQPLTRYTLMLLRCVAAGLLVWMLLGPSRMVGSQDQGPPPSIIMLADLSASMAETDMPGRMAPDLAGVEPEAASRWAVVQQHWLEDRFIDTLRQRGSFQLLTFGQRVEAVDPLVAAAREPDQPRTGLFRAVRQALPAVTQAGEGGGVLLLLTDGHDTEQGTDPGLAAQLAHTGWQVLAVPLGQPAAGSDVAVMAWSDADYVLEGQSTWISATVVQRGYDRASIPVELITEDGRLIERQVVEMGGESARRVRFRVTPTVEPDRPATLHGYRVVVPPLTDERVVENNERWVFVQARKDRIKVALFEAEPYWDTKFLARVLRDDTQVDLVAAFALGPDRVSTTVSLGGQQVDAGEQGPPLTAEQLRDFDVVILGRGCERFFPAQHMDDLRGFVEQGGALVLARGQPFDTTTPLGRAAADAFASLSPVTWGRDTVEQLGLSVTAEGRDSPLLVFKDDLPTDAVVTRLPDMLAATRLAQEKAASVVLLRQRPRGSGSEEAPAMAAVAYQQVGSGRVFAVLSDGLWQWAFLPSSLRELDSVYQVFWSRAVRWLVTGGEFLPGQQVSLSLDRFAVSPGESLGVTVTTRQPPEETFQPELTVRGPDGEAETVELTRTSEQSQRFAAMLRPQAPGVYHVTLAGEGLQDQQLASRFAVYHEDGERLDPSARPQVLEELATATGGALIEPTRPQDVLPWIDAIRAAATSQRSMQDDFNRPWVLVLLFAALGIDWFIRRRQGLL